MLYLTGYGLTLDDLKNFRQLGSPDRRATPSTATPPGSRTTTGPLGQGISNAVGLALAERMLAARFNRDGHDIVDHHTYTIASDGDLQEGVASEACSLAGHLGLGRLIAFYDDNHIQLDGDTALAFSEDVGEALRGLRLARAGPRRGPRARPPRGGRRGGQGGGRPAVADHRPHAHRLRQPEQAGHKRRTARRWARTRSASPRRPTAGRPTSTSSSPTRRSSTSAVPSTAGRSRRPNGRSASRPTAAAEPDLAAEFERIVARELPDGWDADVPARRGDDRHAQGLRRGDPVGGRAGARAGRRLGRPRALDADADRRRRRRRGRATTAGATCTSASASTGWARSSTASRCTTSAPSAATFLIFSDYMKGAIRLAALMRIPSIFVYTHDSIGLGEDGPTHQPIEQLATLRATPNLNVVRPADANETALAWRFAIAADRDAHRAGALAPGPADVEPGRRPRRRDRARRLRAARVLQGPRARPDPDRPRGRRCTCATPPPTCSRPTGIATRVVSVPCLDRFAEQDEAYRDSVLPPACRARLAVEAASPLSWYRWVGDAGDVLAMEGFGASGPQKAALRALRLHAGEHRRARPRRRRARRRERRRPPKGGERMSVTTEVNPRLAALTAAGTSVWLDQIRRSLIEGGELAAAGRRGLAARRDLQPGDLREGDPRLRRLRRRARARWPRRGWTPARSTTASRSRTSSWPPTCCARSGTRPAAPTASSRSRSRPTSRTTPRARSSRRATTGSASTGPT